MREIKFKAKSMSSDKWVFGHYRYAEYEACIPNHYIYEGLNACHPVQKSTVCQFTGLKDENGVEIYEGDICKLEGTEYVWQWDKNHACFDLNLTGKGTLSSYNNIYSAYNCEITGNIHDKK